MRPADWLWFLFLTALVFYAFFSPIIDALK